MEIATSILTAIAFFSVVGLVAGAAMVMFLAYVEWVG